MDRDQRQRRRQRSESGVAAAEPGPGPEVRLARVIRSPVLPRPASSSPAVVVELGDARVSVARDADPDVVAVVLAILRGGGR